MIQVKDTAVEGGRRRLRKYTGFPLPPVSCRRKPGGMDSGKYPKLSMMYNRAGDLGQRTPWQTKIPTINKYSMMEIPSQKSQTKREKVFQDAKLQRALCPL